MSFLKEILLMESVERDMMADLEKLNSMLSVGEVKLTSGRGFVTEAQDGSFFDKLVEKPKEVQTTKSKKRPVGASKKRPVGASTSREEMMDVLDKVSTTNGADTKKTSHTLMNDLYWQYSLSLQQGLKYDEYFKMMPCTGCGFCGKTCLANSGGHSDAVQGAANKRSEKLFANAEAHDEFIAEIEKDLRLMSSVAKTYLDRHLLQGLVCRLNNFSDYPVDVVFADSVTKVPLMVKFPHIMFQDYSKVYVGGKGTQRFVKGEIDNAAIGLNQKTRANKRASYKTIADNGGGNMDIFLSNKYPNYNCIYSFDGINHQSNYEDCCDLLERGYSIAVIFDTLIGKLPIPTKCTFGDKEYDVIVGDFTDMRSLDRARYQIEGGFIVGLSYRNAIGAARKAKNLNKIQQAENEDDEATSKMSEEEIARAIEDLKKYYGVDYITAEDVDINYRRNKPNAIDLIDFYDLDHRVYKKMRGGRVKYWSDVIRDVSATKCYNELWPKLAADGYEFWDYSSSSTNNVINKDAAVSEYNADSEAWENKPFTHIMNKNGRGEISLPFKGHSRGETYESYMSSLIKHALHEEFLRNRR